MDGLVINAATLAAAQKLWWWPSRRSCYRCEKSFGCCLPRPTIRMVQDRSTIGFRIGWIDFESCCAGPSAAPNVHSPSMTDHAECGDSDIEALQFLEQQPTADQLTERGRPLAAVNANAEKPMSGCCGLPVLSHSPQSGLLWLARLMPFDALAVHHHGQRCFDRDWGSWPHPPVGNLVSTVVEHLAWQGFLGYAVALVLAKTHHEVDITATRYGVRVAHMGVAMLVLSDVTIVSEELELTTIRTQLWPMRISTSSDWRLPRLRNLAPEGA
jgi:hypothetical protein